MAGVHAREASLLQHCPCGDSHHELVQQRVEEAERCLESSLGLTPAHEPAYQALVDLYEGAKLPDKAAEVHRRALQQLPDRFDSLLFLAKYHAQRDEPFEARPFVLRARQAKPLDPSLPALIWDMHTEAARALALRGDFAQARREFEQAVALLPERRNDFDLLARRAVLELKAGCHAESHALVTQAVEGLPEPTPLWLSLSIQSALYLLPDQAAMYDERWTEALRRRCQGSTAARMCRLFEQPEYQPAVSARRDRRRKLIDYVRRCSRVKWQAEELRDVCAFLINAQESVILKKFVRKGVKQFSEMAFFHLLEARLAVEAPWPRRSIRRGRTSLKRALELAKKSSDPRERELVEPIQQLLTVLEEDGRLPRRPHFGPGRTTGSAFDDGPAGVSIDELRSEFAALCDELGLDFESLMEQSADEDEFPFPVPRRRRKKSD
jgi:tetratricopeptide (TPR) repeat protein